MKAKPMAVRESVAGDGKLCGAVLLDDGFLSLLRTKIPREIWASLTPEGIQETLHTEWEQGIKVQFMNTIKQWLVRVNDGTSADQSHLPQVKLDRYYCPLQEQPKTMRVLLLTHAQTGNLERLQTRPG